ncbi:hypothetical protein AHMF7605_19610 [Adhaeribacter arboris]|uniref:Uncharacterized protein n=1 Tax=Adhaeribacter arboris TaxID=2072846 RepID=A0A2T2YJ65_9BACT|nr:hypothetical protein [Adhaeribacter arboris]PSR55554.1 hypothetical protein AHMF7605_19610 [Adhaeribacter arboris]
MLLLLFEDYNIEIINDPTFEIGSADNLFNYDIIFDDDEAINYNSSNHGIKIFKEEQLYKSAVVCAVAGATTVHKNSAVIYNDNILVCCANKVFSISLPDLELNWITQVDQATCFGVFNVNDNLIIHGELEFSRLDEGGNILWQRGLRDVLIALDDSIGDSFKVHNNYIEIRDIDTRIHKIDFNGEFMYESSVRSSENRKKW